MLRFFFWPPCFGFGSPAGPWRRGWPPAGVTGLFAWVYGAGFLAAVQCLAARWGAFWLLWLCPPLLGLAGAAAARYLLCSPQATLWAGLCLAFAVCCSAANPHPLRAGAAALDRDLLWNMGNAAALARHFPAEDLRVSGVRFAYHYLTELLWAALARVSGAKLFDVYFYYAGPVFLAGELRALAALARCCWPGQRPVARRCYALVFGFSCLSLWTVLGDGLSRFGNTLLAHLLTNVNAQATALPFFAGVFCTYTALARREMRGGWRQWLGLFAAFLLFCVAKGPQAALTLCGLAAAGAWLLALRRVRALPTVAGLAGLLYRFLYAAGTGSMEFSLFAMRDTLVYRLLSPLTDRLCALLPGSGYFWLFCLGLCNVFCMLPFQCVRCLYALPAALRRLPHPDPAGLLTTVCLVLAFAGCALPCLAACAGGTPLPAAGPAVTAADEAAMQWLAANSAPDDVFATNRISGTPALTDAISNVYTGLSGRRAYLEGWTYAATNMGVSREVLDYKRWINESLTGGALPVGEAGEIALQENIQWLVMAKAWPGEAPPGLLPVYENAEVAIYRLAKTGNKS